MDFEYTIPADVTDTPPSGLDRADGLIRNNVQFPGTALPSGCIYIIRSDGTVVDLPSNSGFFEEDPNSPEIERGEQATITHKFYSDPTNAQAILISLGRGHLMLDSYGNVTRVLSQRQSFKRGGYNEITITSEGTNFDVPFDTWNVETVEFNPSIYKHPRYNILSNYQKYLIRQQNQVENLNLQSQFTNLISSPAFSASLQQQSASLELLNKLHKGFDSFYLAGIKVTWTQYSFLPQVINAGGYIENPISEGGLPYYIWSQDGSISAATDSTSYNIFQDFPYENPNFYMSTFGDADNPTPGISWLRYMDVQTFQRTWYATTRTWIGGPIGHWDREAYSYTYLLGEPIPLPYNTNPSSTEL